MSTSNLPMLTAQTDEAVKNQTDEAVKNTVLLLTGLSDPYTKEHCILVAEIASRIAKKLGFTSFEIERINLAGFLHDVGKQAVPKILLSRPGKLSSQEYELVKTHVQVGIEILKKLNVSSDVIRMIGEHHERLDGSGYPNGLKGTAISFGGQIIGVADVVSALISKRTYHTASTPLEIEKILTKLVPHQMASKIVIAALDCIQSDIKGIFIKTDYMRDVQKTPRHYH